MVCKEHMKTCGGDSTEQRTLTFLADETCVGYEKHIYSLYIFLVLLWALLQTTSMWLKTIRNSVINGALLASQYLGICTRRQIYGYTRGFKVVLFSIKPYLASHSISNSIAGKCWNVVPQLGLQHFSSLKYGMYKLAISICFCEIFNSNNSCYIAFLLTLLALYSWTYHLHNNGKSRFAVKIFSFWYRKLRSELLYRIYDRIDFKSRAHLQPSIPTVILALFEKF